MPIHLLLRKDEKQFNIISVSNAVKMFVTVWIEYKNNIVFQIHKNNWSAIVKFQTQQITGL